MQKLWELRGRANEAANTAGERYARHFNKRVRQQPVFWKEDLVYVDSSAAIKATEGAVPNSDPPWRPRPKNNVLYWVIQLGDYT